MILILEIRKFVKFITQLDKLSISLTLFFKTQQGNLLRRLANVIAEHRERLVLTLSSAENIADAEKMRAWGLSCWSADDLNFSAHIDIYIFNNSAGVGIFGHYYSAFISFLRNRIGWTRVCFFFEVCYAGSHYVPFNGRLMPICSDPVW